MAVAVVAFIGTKAVDAESTTGWNTGNLDTDTKVEGSGSVGAKTSNAIGRFYDLTVTGSPYDFSSGGANDGDHIFGWLNGITPVDTLANGGLALVVADDLATDSVGEWYVGPPTGYTGGFINFVANPAADFDNLVAAGTASWTVSGNPAQLTGVDGFGGRIKTITTIMGNFNNALVDAISVGTGYRITRGDSTDPDATFDDLTTYELNSSNRFGAIAVLRSGDIGALCKIIIGEPSGANSTVFVDSNKTITWLDATASATLYELSLSQGTGTTDVTLTNSTLKAQTSSQAALPLIDLTGVNSVTFTNVALIGARGINLDGAVTYTNSTWQDCGQIDLGGQPTLSGITILDPTDDGAMLVNAANELANVSDITFDGAGVGGTSADAAIEIDITGAGPFSLTFDNIKFQNRVSGSVDVHVLANGNADYTISIINGGSTPTVTNDGTGTVTVQNTKTVTITCKDSGGTAIQDALVRVEAAPGGDLPSDDTVSITRSGSTATVTHTAHGLASNDYVNIRGTAQPEYRGRHQITVTGANSYTYTVSGAPASPATAAAGKTITSTASILQSTTNASGVVQTTTFPYTSDQPIRGTARKATSGTLYKTTGISGTITTNGADIAVVMQVDT